MRFFSLLQFNKDTFHVPGHAQISEHLSITKKNYEH